MKEKFNELNVIKCEKCGGLMRKHLIDYEREYQSETITVKDVEGFICPHCNNQFINESIKDFIEQQIKSEVLKIISKKDIEYITVSYLKRIRNQKGLSQKELGDALGVSEQRYGAIERNTNTPIISMTLILANFLGVGVQDLYKLVIVPKELYDKLLNYNSNLVTVEEVAQLRETVKNLRQDLEDYNNLKRRYRYMLNDRAISKEEADKKIKELDKKINEIKAVKDGTKGLESDLKKLETKHSIIMKQESVMDIDDWEKVEKKYKKELKIK